MTQSDLLLSVLTGIVCLTGLVYMLQLMRFRAGLSRLSPGRSKEKPAVAVIIAARNEEEEIGGCLESVCAQDYPGEQLQVIVVDDGSTDSTSEIVREFSLRDDRVRLIRIENPPAGIAPKKHAVSRGIEESDSEIILLTDADSRAGSSWIETLMAHFTPEVGMVLGFTHYRPEEGIDPFFLGLQTMDFLSLDFVSAGAVGAGQAFVSNANNLAFRRTLFSEVGGYGSAGRFISGDDDLLLQKVAGETEWGIRFAVEQGSFVSTRPTRSVGEFFRQRMRWASKSTAYNRPVLLFTISTFLFFLGLPILLLSSLLGPLSIAYPLTIRGLKALSDYLVMRRGFKVFGQQWRLGHFVITELLHIPYILTIAVGSQLLTHEWRDRRSGRKVG